MAYKLNPITGKLDYFELGVTDHGALTGLGDDDHPQYHNNARGDARYSQLGHGHAKSDITGLIADLASKEPTIAAGATSQYWRGDKSWQDLNQSAVAGLTPSSTPTFASLNLHVTSGAIDERLTSDAVSMPF